MKGSEAIALIMAELEDQLLINANGFIGREAFNARDREANFYMIGSMGLASSMGLGVALAQPKKKIVVLDGDGNILMAMGTLAMIAAVAPKNLVHVTIDNGVYESTGSQRTLSDRIELQKSSRRRGGETFYGNGGSEKKYFQNRKRFRFRRGKAVQRRRKGAK